MTTAGDQHRPVIDRWAVAGLHQAIQQKALFTRPAWTSGPSFAKGVSAPYRVCCRLSKSAVALITPSRLGPPSAAHPPRTPLFCSMHFVAALSFAARGLVVFLCFRHARRSAAAVGSHTGRLLLRQTMVTASMAHADRPTDQPCPGPVCLPLVACGRPSALFVATRELCRLGTRPPKTTTVERDHAIDLPIDGAAQYRPLLASSGSCYGSRSASQYTSAAVSGYSIVATTTTAISSALIFPHLLGRGNHGAVPQLSSCDVGARSLGGWRTLLPRENGTQSMAVPCV